MNTNKSPSKTGKSALGNLLTDKTQKLPNRPTLVPPVLQQVGKLAAGVANVSTDFSSSGSATGNPRNKTALQPGHSLMDWIRLGASGKDLAGVGPNAGHLSVTKQELSKHNKIDDIWVAIRGKVYNVTAYIPFHPGGPEELMKAAGIDATSLFDQVHPWVNYDQILQKCLIGRLVSIDPNTDIDALFYGTNKDAQSQSTSRSAQEVNPKPKIITVKANNLENSNALVDNSDMTDEKDSPGTTKRNKSALSNKSAKKKEDSGKKEPVSPPRFDWIQKLDNITLIFYTKAFCNPLVELYPPQGNQLKIIITYDRVNHVQQVELSEPFVWPGIVLVNFEVGKIEVTLTKKASKIWDNFGTLEQTTKEEVDFSGTDKINYVYKKKAKATNNVYLLMLERTDGCRVVVPLGYHIRAFANIDGREISRSYTPVPYSLIENYANCVTANTTTIMCLMIKRYQNGNASAFLTQRDRNDMVYMSKPLGNFELIRTEKKDGFLMLAGGTGFTPMASLIPHILNRRTRKCHFLKLLFFNKTEHDIPFQDQMEELSHKDVRFSVDHVLSEPPDTWNGLKGHINKEMIDSTISEHIKDTGYTIKDIFLFVCGPPPFTTLAVQELGQLNIVEDQMHVFAG